MDLVSGFNAVYIILALLMVMISMTMHEAMHAYAGYLLGDDTARLMGRLSFNPIKHIDPFLTIILPLTLAIAGLPVFGGAKPVPFNPHNVKYGEWGAAIIALAGPLTNFFMAFIAYGIWVLFGAPSEGIVGEVFALAVTVNLGFFIFNLIPIPPLDGSRVLYALAPEFVRRGMEIIENMGVMIVFMIMLLASSTVGLFISSTMYFFIQLFERIFG